MGSKFTSINQKSSVANTIEGSFNPSKQSVSKSNCGTVFTSSGGSSLNNSKQTFDPSSSLGLNVNDTETTKVIRPHSALVTERVIMRLMTEGPLTISDLVGNALDGPTRELIQSILDVLQVLDIVVQLKTSDPSSTTASSATNNQVLYALSGLAKGPEYVELSRMIESTQMKIEKTKATRDRIEILKVEYTSRC